MNYRAMANYLLMMMHNIDSPAAELNKDLAKISCRVQKWKMSFNSDHSQQCQEVIFSRKVNKVPHPPLTVTKILQI